MSPAASTTAATRYTPATQAIRALAPGTAMVSLRVGPGPYVPLKQRGSSRNSNPPPARTRPTAHNQADRPVASSELAQPPQPKAAAKSPNLKLNARPRAPISAP